MARISFIGDDGDALEIAVGPDNPEVLVGRHRTCAIRTSTQSVSRQHARIFYDGERYWLQDNGSSNGTYYKNERLEPQESVEVEDGEFFMCGNFEMRFDLDDEDLRAHARRAGGAMVDTIDEYDDFAAQASLAEPEDATRFAAPAEDWGYEQAPPPVPQPPAPPARPVPPPPPPVADPPPVVRAASASHAAAPPPPSPPSSGRSDAAVVEELRAALEARGRDLADREKRLQSMEIELESLGSRLADSNDEGRILAMQDELARLQEAEAEWQAASARLVEAEAELARRSEELDLANQEGEANRQEIEELRGEVDELRREADASAEDVGQLRAALAASQEMAAKAGESEAAQATIEAYEDEISTLKDDIRHIEEKYEEARAGRRNAEQLADLLRSQSDTFRASADSLRHEVEQLRASSGGGVAIATVEAARLVAEARVLELTQQLASRPAPAASVVADPAVAAERDQALDDLEDAEHRIAQLERQLAEQATSAAAPAASPDAALVESLRAALSDAQGRLADAEAAAQAPAPAPAPVADVSALHREIETLRTDRDDLEAAASANMKRIKKLLEDLEAARAAGAAHARAPVDDPRVAQLQSELVGLQAELQQARTAVDAMSQAPADAGGQDLTDVRRLVSELNGVVSSFRSDFMSLADSYDAARSDDPEEAAEAMEALGDAIDACTARTATLKELVLSLRERVGG